MLLISNPVAGAGKGPEFIEHHVLPLLEEPDVELVTTKSTGHAGLLAIKYVSDFTGSEKEKEPVIIVSGGDGTLHEVINGLSSLPSIIDGSITIEIVLLPLGTANALYSSLFPPKAHKDLEVTHPAYKLLSLRSYLDQLNPNLSNGGAPKCVPLAVQSTSFLDANGGESEKERILSVVVTSTSLHASILDTADRLKKERTDLVGVERFKVAAMENISNWYYADVSLRPFSTSTGPGEVLKYNSPSKKFESCTETQLEGPFEYFLSTVNADRLESDFVIAPLHCKLPSSQNQAYMDVVIIRPFRHPSLKNAKDNEDNRKKFVEISTAALQAAYKDGAHVDLKYKEDGSCAEDGGEEPVVEYFRCGGWEWSPVHLHQLIKTTTHL